MINEMQYLKKARNMKFGPELLALTEVPSERAWLTVFDDIGKYRPASEADKVSVQAAWYALIDPRYNRRRWTIFTSERSMDELANQGTIDDALYTRIYEMTQGMTIVFDGKDYRLEGP